MSKASGSAQVTVGAVEELLKQLPAVLGARVVVNDWGGIQEIHVLSDRTRSPKVVVRNVESALAARWGIFVDHKKISVAQLMNHPPKPRNNRLRINTVEVSQQTSRGFANISLELVADPERDILGRPLDDPELEPGPFVGQAHGPDTPLGLIRMGAEAAVMAINQALRPGYTFALDGVGRVPTGNHDVATVVLRLHGTRQEELMLSGSALVRGQHVEAGVRAALNASNRLYGRLVRRRDPVQATGLEGVEPEAVALQIARQQASSETQGSPIG